MVGVFATFTFAAASTISVKFEVEVSTKIDYLGFVQDSDFQKFIMPFAISFDPAAGSDPASFVQLVRYSPSILGQTLEAELPWGPGTTTLEPKQRKVSLVNFGDPLHTQRPRKIQSVN